MLLVSFVVNPTTLKEHQKWSVASVREFLESPVLSPEASHQSEGQILFPAFSSATSSWSAGLRVSCSTAGVGDVTVSMRTPSPARKTTERFKEFIADGAASPRLIV